MFIKHPFQQVANKVHIEINGSSFLSMYSWKSKYIYLGYVNVMEILGYVPIWGILDQPMRADKMTLLAWQCT